MLLEYIVTFFSKKQSYYLDSLYTSMHTYAHMYEYICSCLFVWMYFTL